MEVGRYLLPVSASVPVRKICGYNNATCDLAVPGLLGTNGKKDVLCVCAGVCLCV